MKIEIINCDQAQRWDDIVKSFEDHDIQKDLRYTETDSLS